MAKRKDSLAIFSDKPTNVDLLNFKDYSNLLTNVIVNSETPSTIGVFGEWGSGKTSLMLMIEELLQKKNIKTIWFNAWKYDKEEALWRALILCVLRGLSSDKNAVDDTTLKLYEAISSEKLGQMQIDWLEIGKTFLKGAMFISGLLVAPLFLIPGFADVFTSSSFLSQLSNAFTRRKIQQSRERISSIEQFEYLYKKLITSHVQDGERVVILIDDLDRCVPIRSLEVLEALKSFLDADGCIYVVACDTRLINQGLQEKYFEKSNISLDDYLGKIIQFSFTIPPIHIKDAERFISNFGLAIGSDEIARLISKTLERNPRKIKRFLSDLKIKSQLIKSRKLLLKPESLVKMSCITYTWRDFWLASINDTSIFSRAQKISLMPDEIEKSIDDTEFGKLFHIDQQLYNLLKIEPFITESDLHEFIFLSTTTSANLSENEILSKSELVSDSQRAATKIYSSKLMVDQRFYVTRGEVDKVIAAIKKGTSLVLVSGHYGTGKTTLLYMIDQNDSIDYVATYIDLGILRPTLDLNILYYEMARVIQQSLTEKGYSIQFEPKHDLLALQEFEIFISSAIDKLSGKRLVVMFDEILQALIADTNSALDFIENIKFLISKNLNLTIILSGQFESTKIYEPIMQKLLSSVDLNIELSKVGLHNFTEIYEGLTSLPFYKFGISEAYNLLYLFENELRTLVSTQFSLADWWKQGLTLDLYEKAVRNDMTLDFFTLGDLFKLITAENNWEKIFKGIFVNKSYIQDKVSVILRVRNKIAHSREVSYEELQDFVSNTLDMLKIIHKINFG